MNIYLIFILVFFSFSPVVLSLVVPLCQENRFRREYYIPDPPKCIKPKTTLTINCSADVYYPNDNYLKIPITTCEMYETTSETTYYFFGAKINKQHTQPLSAPSVVACADWARKSQSACRGKLIKQSDNSWSTSNKPQIKYVWPTSHKESVQNAVVMKTTGIYDPLRKKLSTPLNPTSNCIVRKGSCITGNSMHIWQVPTNLDCPRVSKMDQVHNVILHVNEKNNVYRAEIKQLGISLHF